jgi:ribosomal protein S18 acetylase RimI-like enzyme
MTDENLVSPCFCEQVNLVNDELVAAFATLLPQLTAVAATPTRESLAEIIGTSANTVLVARDRSRGGRIVGMLTLVVFHLPSGARAAIEDVVVDADARGMGVGEALTRRALEVARAKGALAVDLTSRPSREAANALYVKVGFRRRETNVYRYTFQESGDGPLSALAVRP